MTLILELPPQLENRLRHEAERQGLSTDAYTLKLLEDHLPSHAEGSELTKLLQSWIEEEDEEQAETGEYLIRVLDEDRLSDRRLFPPELKGITW